MDKCWFVLRQTDYPPPTFPDTPLSQAKGPICLGHLIPSLKCLDQVLNPNPVGPDPYPRSMPIWPTTKHSLAFTKSTGHDISLSAMAQVPTGIVPGLDVGGDIGLAFKRSVSQFWKFERLETFIIQPTRPYIMDSLDDGGGPVSEYLERKQGLAGKSGSWTLYMVSGIVVARGAKSGYRADVKETSGNIGGKTSVFSIGEVGSSIGTGNKEGFTAEIGAASDFVWALKLTKISKSLFGKDWEMGTASKGATYSLSKEGEENGMIEDILAEEGLLVGKEATVFKVGEDEQFIISH